MPELDGVADGVHATTVAGVNHLSGIGSNCYSSRDSNMLEFVLQRERIGVRQLLLTVTSSTILVTCT